MFSVFISTLYPKDVHPFVQPGHHQMFAAAWGEHLFCFRIQSIVFSKTKFLTLHDVTCKVYWVFLSTLQTLLAAPQDVTQFVVAKFKPLRQLQRTKELVKQSEDGSFDFLL